MSEEIWKDVKGYEGYYQVSNLGRVRSLDRTTTYSKHYIEGQVTASHSFKGKILSQGKTSGYLSVVLSKNGKNKDFLVHRLVARAFVPNDNPSLKTQVDHLDGDRENNYASNLTWVTPRENQLRSIKNGTHVVCNVYRKVQVIDVDTGKIYESMRAAEDEFQIPHGRISAAIRSNQRVYGHKFELVETKNRPLF